MPTNRPFLANLLVAFRAHSAATQASASSNNSPPSKASTNKPQVASGSTSASSSTSTSTSTSTTSTSAAQTASSNSQPLPMLTPSRGRRGSSSSTEGFVEPSSGEKWWIGGRNSDGQGRFYRLQPVRRHRSYDRLSLDRQSL